MLTVRPAVLATSSRDLVTASGRVTRTAAVDSARWLSRGSRSKGSAVVSASPFRRARQCRSPSAASVCSRSQAT
ncbi:hypothetical protein SFUMM280S_00271 [Streptomyces fumanus]